VSVLCPPYRAIARNCAAAESWSIVGGPPKRRDVARLVECEFLEWERGGGGGSLIILTVRRTHGGDRDRLPRNAGGRADGVTENGVRQTVNTNAWGQSAE
jgi:hypothetical protein